MTADVALLREVAGGAAPALRVYRWSRPALSLGRFQPETDVDDAACARFGVEIVRRPTGGRALLHGGDLTYAVAVPKPSGAAGSVDAVYGWLASGLVAGLARLGVDAAVAHGGGSADPACFTGMQGADLRVGERKLCGSAQLQRDGVVLQHGAILLERLGFDETDVLRAPDAAARAVRAGRLRDATVTLGELGACSGAAAVADALVAGFAATLGLELEAQPRPPVDVETQLPPLPPVASLLG